MNVGSKSKTGRFKRYSEVLLHRSKTVFVNTVYKLFKRLFSYTRLNAKLGFSKTSFVNTTVGVLYRQCSWSFFNNNKFFSLVTHVKSSPSTISPTAIRGLLWMKMTMANPGFKGLTF